MVKEVIPILRRSAPKAASGRGGAAIGRFRPLRTLMRCLAALLVCFLLWVASVQLRIMLLPDREVPPKEVGIVLGASLWQDVPSPALRERLDRAASLYRSGAIAHVIVSGGYDRPDAELTEAEGMRNYLVGQGVPNAAIVLENEARSTYENLAYSQALMRSHGWTSAVIITHRYHMLRALDMARYLGYDRPAASPMESKVLMMAWHQSRETAAYAKWQLDKLLLLF